MPWKSRCKVTVLRREFFPELAQEYLSNPDVGKCSIFQEGDEFLIDKDDYMTMLGGRFCAEAWDAISHYIYAALQGAPIMHGWSRDESVFITCCNDGIRPVIFKIERLDD